MSKIFLKDASAAPDRIRFMPLGVSYVNATLDDEPAYITVEVTETDLEGLNADLQESIKAAQEDRQSFPFVDFNHENEAAAAHPVKFELSQDGQYIDMLVEWTDKGKASVEAKEYLYFSPTLLLEPSEEDEVHKLYGITTNVGGLTNTPAFVRQRRVMAASKPNSPHIQFKDKKPTEVATMADNATVDNNTVINDTLITATPSPEPPAKPADIVKLEAELPDESPEPIKIVEPAPAAPAQVAPTVRETLQAQLAGIKSDKERCDFIVRNWSKLK